MDDRIVRAAAAIQKALEDNKVKLTLKVGSYGGGAKLLLTVDATGEEAGIIEASQEAEERGLY